MRRAETLTALSGALFVLGCTSLDLLGTRPAPVAGEDRTEEVDAQENPVSTPLPNVLEDRANVSVSQVDAQLNEAFLQLFFGDPETEAVYFDQGDGTAYIMDIANGDVRTDSMAYGLLTTVQLDQREVFDRLWSWVKTHMLMTEGVTAGLLSWRCDVTGTNCETAGATDASSIIATSLFMAEARWGEAGRFDYEEEALALLEVLVAIEERNGGVIDNVKNSFDMEAALPRDGSGAADGQVRVDYLMPAFYEIWATYDEVRATFWRRTAANSRALLYQIAHPSTGLLPGAVDYAGTPVPGQDAYVSTTARALLNVTLDHLWYGPHDEVVEQNRRLLDFFLAEGIDDYKAAYTLDGRELEPFNTAAHRSLVALAAVTVEDPTYDPFIEALWAEPIPTETYRYYDGMLYMLSLLVASGQLSPP